MVLFVYFTNKIIRISEISMKNSKLVISTILLVLVLKN